MIVGRGGPLLAAMALAACGPSTDQPAHNTAAEVRPVQAGDVAGLLARSGLPVTDVTVLTASTDPDHLLGKPGQYTSKATFSDHRHPHAGKNLIEVFGTLPDAMRRAEVVTSGATDSAAVTRYQAVSGKAYLRLDENMPADEADQYRTVFATLGL